MSRHLIAGELYQPAPDHTIARPGQGWIYTKRPRRDMDQTLGDATADFAIFCKKRCFMTHKYVLARNSSYFERMFRFSGLEMKDNKVEIPDVPMFSMKLMLDFIYTRNYTLRHGIPVHTDFCTHTTLALQSGNPNAGRIFKRKCKYSSRLLSPTHFVQHVEMYGLADYFMVDHLKEYALEGIEAVLHVYWTHDELHLVDALEAAFTNTPDADRGARKCLIGILGEHPGLWVDEGDVRDWLDQNPLVWDEVTKLLEVFKGSHIKKFRRTSHQ